MRKFRRRNCIAVMLHYDALWQKLLINQELFEHARKIGFNFLPVGYDISVLHEKFASSVQAIKAESQSFHTGS